MHTLEDPNVKTVTGQVRVSVASVLSAVTLDS